MQIKNLIAQCHQTAVDKGWWTLPLRRFGESIALMHSELSEALEEYRKGRDPQEEYYETDGKPCGIPSELADLLIRVFDVCGQHDINLEEALKKKMSFNKTRPYRHGNKTL